MNFWLVIDLISATLATVAGVTAWWFVVLYRCEQPWRETLAGQHLMRFTAGLAVILTWVVGGVVARIVWPDNEILRVALGLGRCIIFAWLSWMLIERLRLLRSAINQRQRTDIAYDTYLAHRNSQPSSDDSRE